MYNIEQLLEEGQYILSIFDQADAELVYNYIKDICIVLKQLSQ